MMAATEAMPAPPQMETEALEPRVSMTEAMDVLDEFHIKRSDMQRVYNALETILEPADDMGEQPEAAGGEDAMAAEMFAPGRNRKAM